MYTKILVPLDGSEYAERVLPYATNLALALSLPVTLLYAVEQDHPSISRSLNERLAYATSAHHRGLHARAYAEPVRIRLMDAGLTVDIAVPEGEPGETIVKEAGKDPSTLIAMSSHGRSGVARWWMGSVADRVLHTASNPVLMIHTHDEHPESAAFERLIVPVDGSQIAEQALPHAAHLSKQMGLPVYLIQVVPSRVEYSVANSGFPIVISSYEDFSLIVAKQAEGELEKTREKAVSLGADPVATKLLRGQPADEIANYAASTPSTLTVMTTHGRSGPGRMLLGSVAERVVRQAGVPVLLIRAKGTNGTNDRFAYSEYTPSA